MEAKKRIGYKGLIAIFLAAILVFSFGAQMISSRSGNVKISDVVLDVRGARLDSTLYYPADLSEEDKLPAIVVNHGGAVSKGVVRGIAEELAARGFVVMNIDAYGGGMSEASDTSDASSGILDAVNYLRELSYVDTERIGVVGHSAGSTRAVTAAMLDAGAYTQNDLLINILYDTFQVSLSAEEIYEDADTLAAKYLNADQLNHYEMLKTEAQQKYNTRIRAVALLGTSGKSANVLETVQVAGHDVLRNYQFNMAIIDGDYDERKLELISSDWIKNCWYTQDVQTSVWYQIDDKAAASEVLGDVEDTTVLNNDALKNAFENRQVRMFTTNPETHSKNFFSAASASDVVKFMTQAMHYNNGELGASDAEPAADDHIVYLWRALLNGLAMFSMIGLLISIAGTLTRTGFFAECTLSVQRNGSVRKKMYWLVGILNICLGFLAIYLANNAESGPKNLIIPTSGFFPLGFAADTVLKFVFLLGIFTLVLLVVVMLLRKKTSGDMGLKALQIRIGIKALGKSVLLAFLLLLIGYLTLEMIMYLFHQDYRVWSLSFTSMKAEYWPIVPRYALIVLPVYLICSAMTNFTIRDDIPGWLDDTIAVITGSAGVWLCGLVNLVVAMTSFDGTLFASFIMTYSTMLFVPIVTLINRKLYRITNSIWLGALVSALLFGWVVTSSAGCGQFSQSFISVFFGA